MTRVIEGTEELRSLVGEEIGTSAWQLIDQDAIDRFAEATGDHYFIHVDPDRARAQAGLPSTIAHGLFTLSLGPKLAYEIVEIRGVGSALNYGYDKVRFTASVPVDSRLRLRLRLTEVEESARGIRVTYEQSFELEGSERPVCVSSWVFFYWQEKS